MTIQSIVNTFHTHIVQLLRRHARQTGQLRLTLVHQLVVSMLKQPGAQQARPSQKSVASYDITKLISKR